MKKSVIIGILLLVFTGITSCTNNNEIDNETGNVLSREAIITFSDQCGYLVHIYTGNMGHFHDMIYTPDNLPDAYKIDGLPVNVTYRQTGEIWNCENSGRRYIINIIKIQKR